MKNRWLALGLSLALVALGATAVSQARRAASAERVLEEAYQSALSESCEALQALSIDMEKLLVSGDPSLGAALLHQISRSAGEVHRGLSFLPLSHEAVAPTISFVARLSDYTASLLPELVREGALDSRELDALSGERAAAVRLTAQLSLASQTMAEDALRFVGGGSAFAANLDAQARPLEILADQDNGMEYPTLIYDGPFSDARRTGAPRGLPEGEITEAEAIDIARAFIGDRALSAAPAPDTSGALPAYGVTVATQDVQLNLEITRQGGRVLWMMPETASFQVVQSVESCRERAAQFLREHGFGEMTATHHQLYDGLCVVNLAAVQDGVLLYPDLVKVQVRMDTGDVVGLEAHSYWMNHTVRALPAPALDESAARARLSDAVESAPGRLCLIPDQDDETLCYEFPVQLDGESYLVYLDAQTGAEVQLLKVIPTDAGTLTA